MSNVKMNDRNLKILLTVATLAGGVGFGLCALTQQESVICWLAGVGAALGVILGVTTRAWGVFLGTLIYGGVSGILGGSWEVDFNWDAASWGAIPMLLLGFLLRISFWSDKRKRQKEKELAEARRIIQERRRRQDGN